MHPATGRVNGRITSYNVCYTKLLRFSHLFGNILSISTAEVITAVVVSCAVLAMVFLHFEEMFSITFDEEFARASGIPVDRLNIVIMVLTAVTVVLAMKVVGIMLTSALLVLPAVTAFQNARGFRSAMLTAVIASLVSLVSGVALSFSLDLPAGASIVVINVVFFGFAFMVRRIAEGSVITSYSIHYTKLYDPACRMNS